MVIVCGLTGCLGNGPAPSTTDIMASYGQTVVSLAPPVPPVMLTDPAERAKWLVAHYWDRFPFTEPSMLADSAAVEQFLVDFLDLLPRVPEQNAHDALCGLVEKTTTYEVAVRRLETAPEPSDTAQACRGQERGNGLAARHLPG